MNYQTIYDGIKILEMNKSSLINIFSIYLKNETKKDNIGTKDKLLYDKFQNFYKQSIIGVKNNDDTDIFLKNTVTLINILSYIASKLSLDEDAINVVYKLMGNLKKLQLKIQTNKNDTDTQSQNKETKSIDVNINNPVKIEKTENFSEKSEKPKKINFSKLYHKKLLSEQEKENDQKFKKEKNNMFDEINKNMTTTKINKSSLQDTPDSTTDESTVCSESPKKVRVHKPQPVCLSSSTKSDSDSIISTDKNNCNVINKTNDCHKKTKFYHILKKPLSLLAKDYYQVRSLMYIYDESANKFIDKYTMFDYAKLIDECDVYNYNLIVKSMFDRMYSTLILLDKNLNGTEKLLCKLHIKNSKINSLKTITISEKISGSSKYVELTYGSKIYDIYYIDSSMTYDQMVKRISDDLTPILEFIRLVCINIIIVCQELETYCSTSNIINTNTSDIYKIVVNDLENCC